MIMSRREAQAMFEPTPIIPLNRARAVANAAQAALSLEEDRENTRQDLVRDLRRKLREHLEAIERIDAALMELAGG